MRALVRLPLRSLGQLTVSLLLVSTTVACGSARSTSAAEARPMDEGYEIVLSAPSAAELNSLRQGGKGQPLQVGFGRPLPAERQQVDLAGLAWAKTASGAFSATVSVRSPGARSVRVGVVLDKPLGLEVSFGGRGDVVATVPAVAIVAGSKPGEPYWSPVIAGDTVVIRLVATQVPVTGTLQLPVLSHIP